MTSLDPAQLESLKGYFTLTAALIAVVGALGGALLTLTGTWLTSFLNFKAHRRSLFVSTVTTERAQWRKDLRTFTAEFVAMTYQLADGKEINLEAFQCRRLEIRLRLNPRGGQVNALDTQILGALEAIRAAALKPERPSLADLQASLEELEDGVQRLLKQEWDKSKNEARTGKLERKTGAQIDSIRIPATSLISQADLES